MRKTPKRKVENPDLFDPMKNGMSAKRRAKSLKPPANISEFRKKFKKGNDECRVF